MEIGRTEGVQGPGNVQGPRKTAPASPTSPTQPGDRVEISETARMIAELTSMPKVRQDRIEAVKKLVESGQFDTKERLAGAIDNLLRENPGIGE